MIRDHDARGAVIDGPARVIDADDAFEHQRKPGERSQPVDVTPGQRGIVQSGEIGGEGGVVLHRRQRSEAVGSEVGQTELGRKLKGVAEITLAPPEHRDIHREHQRLVARCLGPLHETPGECPVLVDVELKPEWAGARAPHIFDAGRGEGAEDERSAERTGGARGSEFAVGMRQAVECHRRHEDRRRIAAAEQGDRGIDRAHIHQHPVVNPERLEQAAVLAQGDLVAGPAGEVVGGTPREAAASEALEVQQVQEAGHGVGDTVRPLLPRRIGQVQLIPLLWILIACSATRGRSSCRTSLRF